MSILICFHDTPCIFSCRCFSASNSSSLMSAITTYLSCLTLVALHFSCLSALLLGQSHWRKTLLIPIPCSKAFDSSQLSMRLNGLFLVCHSGPSTIWCQVTWLVYFHIFPSTSLMIQLPLISNSLASMFLLMWIHFPGIAFSIPSLHVKNNHKHQVQSHTSSYP